MITTGQFFGSHNGGSQAATHTFKHQKNVSSIRSLLLMKRITTFRFIHFSEICVYSRYSGGLSSQFLMPEIKLTGQNGLLFKKRQEPPEMYEMSPMPDKKPIS